jgi:hypothetical protein
MAMKLWVLSDKQLGSIAEWQAAIGAEGNSIAGDAPNSNERSDN